MTPTPREDTMTDQTEQEPIDPWEELKRTIRARIADYSVTLFGHGKRSQQAKEAALAQIEIAIDATRAADDANDWAAQVTHNIQADHVLTLDAHVGRLAAHLRERDAAILRYQTAELEQNAVIARLSAQVEQLRDWQATVTAALQRPSGAFYKDVPRHIRDLRAALSTVDAQIHQQAELLAQRWDTIERLTKQHNEWKVQAEQHAAQVRERDAQIARLSAQVEQQIQEIAVDNELLLDRQRILDACPCPVHGSCVPHVLETLATLDTLRAERDAAQQEIVKLTDDVDGWVRIAAQNAKDANARMDAAQQQIATLTEQQPAVKLKAAITALEALQAQGIYLHGTDGNPLDRAATETAVTTALDAALQSTRPQATETKPGIFVAAESTSVFKSTRPQEQP